MAVNHKITVTLEKDEMPIQISGVLSRKGDRQIEVMFREDTDLDPFRELQRTSSDYVYRLDMFDPVAGVIAHDCTLLHRVDQKITFRVVKEYSPTDRRRHVKVKTNLYGQVTTFLHLKGKKKFSKKPTKGIFYKLAKHTKIIKRETIKGPMMVTAKTPMEIRVDDFNAGGLRFVSAKKIKPGRMFVYNFTDGRREMFLNTKILRREQRSTTFNYSYGCQFVGIRNREEEVLCQYVFQLQAQAMRREREQKQ